MPYTLAHAAAAVPIKRALGRRASLAALAIGTMMPDSPYFVASDAGDKAFAHQPLALLWFCVPVGLAVWWIFEQFLRAPLTALLPESLQRRLPDPAPVGVPMAALSLLLGAATHLLWDAFTQTNSPLFGLLPFLERPVAVIGGDTLYLHRLLHKVSSVVGLAALAGWTWRWARQAPVRAGVRAETGPLRRRAWAVLALFPAAWAMVASIHSVQPPFNFLDVRRAAVVVAVETIRAMVVGILAWAVVWHLRRRSADRAVA